MKLGRIDMQNRIGLNTLVILVLLVAVGCSSSRRGPRLTADGRALMIPENIKSTSTDIPMVVEREALRNVLEKPTEINSIRLVQVFSGQEEAPPRYRLFNIQPGGVYSILGLQNADILVAANDFIVYESDKFPTYVSLLPNEPEGNIRVVRGGRVLNFKYELR